MSEPTHPLVPQPCTLVIFGGSGDLARRKLIPAVYNLLLDGILPPNYAILGNGRTPLSDADFRQTAREAIAKYSRQKISEKVWPDFERRLFFVAGSLQDPKAYKALRQRLEQIETDLKLPGNRIFYLAIPPTSIADAVEGLRSAGLVQPPSSEGPFSRVIVEKPIGRDLDSARKINEAVSRVFDESQIFRIDHYLGKETVQNLLVLRFANSIFEPIWNYKFIDHVQITVAEAEGVGTRATYYEEAGTLRDMVQNHMLQLLCLVAMEPPTDLGADSIRDEKVKVVRSLRRYAPQQVGTYVVRGQYTAGAVSGKPVVGYREEEKVNPNSETETYVALRMLVDNWRWSDVPIYVRVGKRLPKSATEISVHFKRAPMVLFNRDSTALDQNVLVIRIQPDEGISLRMMAKIPGTSLRIEPVKMDFHYGTSFGKASPEAYERLLLDAMSGDPTLFARRDEVEEAWAFIDPIEHAWSQKENAPPLSFYPAGSWGPEEADELLANDGRTWRRL